MSRLLMALATGVLLAGCGTVGVREGTEREIEPEHRLAGYAATGDAIVEVARVARMSGVICAVTLELDGKEVALLGAGRWVRFGVPAGRHLVVAHYAKGAVCPSQLSTVDLQVRAGDAVRLVYDISHHGQHVFQRAP